MSDPPIDDAALKHRAAWDAYSEDIDAYREAILDQYGTSGARTDLDQAVLDFAAADTKVTMRSAIQLQELLTVPDVLDWGRLFAMLPNCAHGKLWKQRFAEVRAILNKQP